MISEIDINDWQQLPVRELYKCKPRSYVMFEDEVFFFDHIDGMYSFCTDLQNNIIHFSAWTPVIPLQKKDPAPQSELV